MNLLGLVTDAYERKARLYPALLLLVPVLGTVIAIASAKLSVLESLGVAVAACGGGSLLAQLARDAGKSREKALFAKWGGMPSMAIFRHRDPRLDAITKERYHKRLAALVKGAKAPSVTEERSDPATADRTYAAWSTYLRVHARDTKKYALLFHENVNYGFRRNLLGLRATGIITSALSFAAAAGWCYQGYQVTGAISEELVGASVLALVFLLLWILRFSEDWVRVPADAYAERLAETADIISAKTATTTK